MERKLAVVTGATSKVMNQLIDLLIAAEFHVIALSRKNRQNETRGHVRWVKCDLTDTGQDYSFLENAEIIFHGAAISNAYNQEEYLHANYQSTIHLVDASKKFGVKKFIYISSILAGYKNGDYGMSKIRSEEYIAEELHNWLIIRPSQLFGYSKTAPIDKLIETIKNKKVVFCPVGDPKALVPLYCKDLVQSVFESAFITDKPNQTLTITGPKLYCYKSLIHEIASALSRKIIMIPIPKVVIMTVYYLIKYLHLKTGIYPDQLFRFYNNHSVTEASTRGNTSIINFLNRDV